MLPNPRFDAASVEVSPVASNAGGRPGGRRRRLVPTEMECFATDPPQWASHPVSFRVPYRHPGTTQQSLARAGKWPVALRLGADGPGRCPATSITGDAK